MTTLSGAQTTNPLDLLRILLRASGSPSSPTPFWSAHPSSPPSAPNYGTFPSFASKVNKLIPSGTIPNLFAPSAGTVSGNALGTGALTNTAPDILTGLAAGAVPEFSAGIPLAPEFSALAGSAAAPVAGATAFASDAALGAALTGSLSGALQAAAPLALPAMAFVPILMDMIFGQSGKTLRQQDEFGQAGIDFNQGANARAAGAATLDALPALSSPQSLLGALNIAAAGLTPDIASAYDRLTHGTGAAGGEPGQTSAYAAVAPQLQANNWMAYLDLLDAATQQGLDLTPGKPQNTSSVYIDPNAGKTPATGGSMVSQTGDPLFTAGPWSNAVYQPQPSALNPLDLNAAIASAVQYFGLPQAQTQNSGGSLAGVATGNTTQGAGGGAFTPEQLTQMGFVPGNYNQAMSAYLLSLDPSLAKNPDFTQWIGTNVPGVGPSSPSNIAGMTKDMDAWSQELARQQAEWDAMQTAYAAPLQAAWTSGGG